MDYSNLSDLELVNRLKQDDRLAFECIFQRHGSELFRHLNYKVDTRNDCDEIIVDVFVALWLGRHFVCTDLKSHLASLMNSRLVFYIRHNPGSQLLNHLKQTLYETHKEEDSSKEEN